MIYILLAVLFFTVTAYSALRNGHIDLSKSLSLHICRSPRSIAIARVCFAAVSILMLVWYFHDYLSGRSAQLDVSIGMIIFTLTILVQGLFPYEQNKVWNVIHNVSAWTAACVGPLLLLRFASIAGGLLQLFLLSAGVLSCVPMLAFAVTPKAKRYFLPLQMSMIVISFSCFLALSMR